MKHNYLCTIFGAAILGATISAGALPARAANVAPTAAETVRPHPGSFHQLANKKLSAIVSVIATQHDLVASNRSPVGNLPPGMRDFMERFFGGRESTRLPRVPLPIHR